MYAEVEDGVDSEVKGATERKGKNEARVNSNAKVWRGWGRAVRLRVQDLCNRGF